MFATVDRARPTRVATSSWVIAKSSTRSAVGVRLFDRVEVGPLEVLDERELELCAIGQLADHGGDPLEPRHLGCPDPPLAGHELVPVEDLGDEDGLDDPVLGDARRELRQGLLLDLPAGLIGIALDPGQGDLDGGGRGLVALRDQGGQATTERARAPFGSNGHASIPAVRGFGRSAWIQAPGAGRASRSRSSAARAAYACAPFKSAR